jgi:putative ABC transport system permease protein
VKQQVPRVAARILAWSLPEADREAVLGDLSEEFLSRAEELNLRTARQWYWNQVRRSLSANVARRFTESFSRRSPFAGSVQDLRGAVRALRAAPGFSVVALFVLAFGIGSSTLIFSMADAVVLRALPFDEPDRIVVVGSLYNGHPGLETAATFLEWRERQTAFEALTAIADGALIIKTDSQAEEVRLERVTAEFFSVLRVRPPIGQPFTADNEVDGRDGVAMISDALWRSRFGADPNIVGETMKSNMGTKTIVGVMPPDFSYPAGAARPTDVWIPYVVPAKERQRATASRVFTLQLLARLKPGLTVHEAQARIQQITDPVAKQYPKWFGPSGIIGVTPLRELIVGDVRRWMLMLLGAVALVLVLTCVNVAGLTLARASGRAQQLAIRAALGASRFRISRGVLAESLVLSGMGAVGGLVLAWWGMSVLRAAIPGTIPRVSSIALNSRVLWFAVSATVATGLSVGIIPAWQAARTSLFGLLKDGGRSSTAGRRPRRTRVALVVAEVTLAVVLLVGTGLFVSSFLRLMEVDVGFDYHRVLTIAVSAPAEDSAWKARGPAIATDIIDRLKHTAAVESAAAISQGLPLMGLQHRVGVALPPGTSPTTEADAIELRAVSPDYFRALRIPIQRGRAFADSDGSDAPLVTILSEEASEKYFDHADPLGATITIEGRDRTVVGIARGVRQGGPETDAQPLAYEPLVQSPTVRTVDFVIRTHGDPLAVLTQVKPVVWSVDPELAIRSATTLDTLFNRLTAVRQFNMLLVSLFGLVGVAVAAAGIYGVVACDVAERSNEIAVRMALGAGRTRVVTDVLKGVAAYIALGLTAGLVGAAALATLIKAFLFDVQPHDVGVYGLVALILASTGLLAAWLPARRAATVDSLISIKN